MRSDSFSQTPTRHTPRQSRLCRKLLAVVLSCVSPAAELSAAGNNAQGTLLDATWGVLLGIIIAIALVIYWPLKTFLQQRRKDKPNQDNAADSNEGDTTNKS